MIQKDIEWLLETHHKEAFLWSYQCCKGRHEDAKDILQMAYLKIMEGKAKYKEKSSFKTWLFSIIRFTAIDYHKKQRPTISLEGISIPDSEVEPFRHKDYRILLQQLPTRQQQVLTLSFYHDMTLAQIADIENLHIGTVRTHYERGKSRLRELINTMAI